MQDAHMVAKAIKLKGFTVKVARQAAYLGIDFSCGRGGRATRTQRQAKHKRMNGQIVRYCRVGKRYQQLS
eukprot:6616486-Pyramimonas_sp.AAC.1